MFLCLFIFLLYGTPSILTEVATDQRHLDRYLLKFEEAVLNRNKRATCRSNQWRCRDGTCIGFDGMCDGIVNCPDGSDETHSLCRNSRCQNNWFQCTYGACVDGTAPCNGVQDCADNSDELHPRCRNESLPILFFKCHNGEQIPVSDQCDGVRHCSDGSDERVETCVAQTCFPYLFQCAYGACVDRGSPCNGVRDCADGSDESEELCHNVVATDDSNKYNDNKSPTQPGVCILPPYPKNGRYRVTNGPNDFPGQSADMYLLNVSCHQGYRLAGDSTVYCFQGYWVPEILPKCLRSCRFTPHPSVEYSCLSDRSSQRRRACNEYEPDGTVIRTRCRPDYNGRPRTMRCVDGNWNSIPQCSMHHQDGTNITILVKDQVEVHISGIQYASNDVTEKKEVEDDGSYDIDEGDLRIGVASKPKPNNNRVNLQFNNSTISIDSDRSIHFRQ